MRSSNLTVVLIAGERTNSCRPGARGYRIGDPGATGRGSTSNTTYTHPRTLAATPRTGASCGRPLGPGADKTSTPKTPCTLSPTLPANIHATKHLTIHEHLFYYQYRDVSRETSMLTKLIGRNGDKLRPASGGDHSSPRVKARYQRERTRPLWEEDASETWIPSPPAPQPTRDAERLIHAVYVGVADNPGPWRSGAYRLNR